MLEKLVARDGRVRSIEKGVHIFRQGEQNRCLYRVQSGLLKASYITNDGREMIKSFIEPGQVITSLAASYRREPCSFSLVALQKTDVIEIEFQALMAAARASTELAAAAMDVILEFAMKKERREYEFLSLSAEERYRILCDTQPQILTQVTQQDIALYLGITPVALSRIKARLASSV